MEKRLIAWSTVIPILEKKDLKRLEKLAREGWFLSGYKNSLIYILKKQPENNVCYRMEFIETMSDDVRARLRESGWKLAAKHKERHIYQAPKGSIYVSIDQSLRLRKYTNERIEMLKTVLMAMIPIIFAYIWMGRVTSQQWVIISRVFFIVSFLPLLLSLIYVVFYSTLLRKLNKGEECYEQPC